MSDLGNFNYNPQGAIFFNLCIILLGIIAIPFFWGISHFKDEISRNNLIKPMQILGMFTSLSFIMVGVFSENAPYSLHFIWSIFSWGFVMIDLIAASIMLRDAPNFLPILGYYGFIIAGINAILLLTWSPFIEWLTFLSTIIFIELIMYSGYKIEFSTE